MGDRGHGGAETPAAAEKQGGVDISALKSVGVIIH